jgi:hypothetical protein
MAVSPNAPILNKILDELKSINTRLTKLEDHVSKIDERVSKLDEYVSIFSNRVYGYIQKESDIQEKQSTELIRRNLALKYNIKNISLHSLRNFYIHGSDKIYTDLDGCIIKRITETWNTNTNHIKRAAENSRAYIIEAKHGLTKQLVDGKLLQFCKILETFEYIRTHKEEITDTKASQFDNMVISYDLFNFPENILFIFASDDITDDLYNYIVSINEGELLQEKYDDYIIKSFKEDDIIREILDNKTIPIMIKNKIKFTSTPSDISSLFTPASLPTSARPVDVALEKYKQLLQPYTETAHNLLSSYTSNATCYAMLKGKLGIYRTGTYYWDEDMFPSAHNTIQHM